MNRQLFKTLIGLWVTAGVLVACGDGGDEGGQLPATTVTQATAERQLIERIETSVGRAHADTAPSVAAETVGRVVEVLVDAGDAVEAGQALARLDGDAQRDALAAARGEVQRLQALADNQARQVARLANLIEGELISDDQFEQAQAQAKALQSQLASAQARLSEAQRNLDHIEIKAPVTGEVETRHVSEGDFVDVGQPAFDLVSAQALQVVLPVSQRLVDDIDVGQSVRLKTMGSGQVTITAPITEIRPVVDGRSRALEAVVSLDNPGRWRAGSSVVGEIVLQQYEAVVVPSVAVAKRPAGDVVYVIDADQSSVREQVVQTGLRQRDGVEIVTGLTAGTAIVLDGAGFLTDGARIEIAQADGGDGQ
jgi:RND family efflux transporter MFP subunit